MFGLSFCTYFSEIRSFHYNFAVFGGGQEIESLRKVSIL